MTRREAVSGAAVSGVGTAVSAVALPLTAVTVLHAPAFQVGLLTAASYAAWLVIGLPAGVLVARTGLRGLQVAMDLVRACALASIPLAWWLGSLSFAQLAATALVDSFATVLFETGNMTLLPAIVPEDQLSARNSLVSGTLAATQLGGPSLGGLLVQLLGAPLAVLGDAVSYLVSAVFMSRLPARRVAQPASRTTMTAMIRDGWRFVARHPVIRPCMWAATLINFICGALLALTPLYLVRVLHTPPGLVGAHRHRRRRRAAGRGADPPAVPGGRHGPGDPARQRLRCALCAGDARRERGGRHAPVRRGQCRVRHRGRGPERQHPHLPADREPAGAAVTGHGHGAGHLLGSRSVRVAAGGRGSHGTGHPPGPLAYLRRHAPATRAASLWPGSETARPERARASPTAAAARRGGSLVPVLTEPGSLQGGLGLRSAAACSARVRPGAAQWRRLGAGT